MNQWKDFHASGDSFRRQKQQPQTHPALFQV